MTYSIQNEALTIRIHQKGAELCSIQDQAGTEFLFQADPTYWARSAPVLFPFVGSLRDKAFSYEGKRYPMGQHGFARDLDFSLVSQQKEEIWFQLASSPQTLERYPMPFVLEAGYRLEGSAIRVMWKVKNPSDTQPLYFSIGAHPAFLCPPEGGGMAGCYLGFDAGKDLSYRLLNGQGLGTEQTHRLALEDGLVRIEPAMFDRDALIVEGKQAGAVWLADREKRPFVKVEFDAPLFGIWSPAGKNAPFVCIEPWYGRCDAADFSGTLEQREYGNCVAPGGAFQAEYRMMIGRGA